MGGLLNATPAALNTLAGRCSAWAVDIAAAVAPDVPAAPGQASAAVAGVNTRLGVASQTLATRMTATGTTLTTVAAGFAAVDQQSADRISSVAHRGA